LDLGIGGKVALVMGASKGIGRGAAEALARDGARVAIASRSRDDIDRAAAEIADAHEADVRGFVADAADVDAMPALVDAVKEQLGPIEILVTNTGGPPVGDPLSFTREQWEDAYRNLVLGPLELINAVVPGMRERSWGRIVNVTSIATHEPIPGFMLSNSHRLAAVGAFKTLSRQLAADGILLNGVAPGRIATDRIAKVTGKSVDELRADPAPDIPVGRLGTAEEVGDVIAFLCSERASYVNGINLLVDGGVAGGI
jgi:3-oxoacyl-[acyl-carrier protein] reductase